MATEKNIVMKEFNGTDYDTLYPKTIGTQVDGIFTAEQTLTNNTKTLYGLGTDAVPDDALARIPSSLVWKKIAEYKTAGAFTYTVPAGVTELGVYMVGGGGSGGAATAKSSSNYSAGASGGAAGYGKNVIMTVTPGQQIPVVVGSGGFKVTANGGSSYSDDAKSGNAGGTTSFNDITVSGGEGGKADRKSSANANGAIGGQGSKGATGLYPHLPIDNLPTYGSTITSVYGDGTSGAVAPNTTAQIPAESQNAFDPLMVTLCCGGWAWANSSYNKFETVDTLPDGTKGGNGNATISGIVRGQSATGNCNGGGGAASKSSAATSGSGSPGMVLIYKRGDLA